MKQRPRRLSHRARVASVIATGVGLLLGVLWSELPASRQVDSTLGAAIAFSLVLLPPTIYGAIAIVRRAWPDLGVAVALGVGTFVLWVGYIVSQCC